MTGLQTLKDINCTAAFPRYNHLTAMMLHHFPDLMTLPFACSNTLRLSERFEHVRDQIPQFTMPSFG